MLSKIKEKIVKNKKSPEPNRAMTTKDYEQLGRAIEQVYNNGYISKWRLIYMSLLRGIAYGVGIFIGGTIIVGIILGIMLQFEQFPIVGPMVEKINQSIENSAK